MSKRIIDAETAKLAGLHIDLLSKIRSNNISLEDVKRGLLGIRSSLIMFEDKNKLANLEIVIWQQVRDGLLSIEKFENFLNRRKVLKNENELFSQPLLEKQVVIPKRFSLDKNIVPKKEFKYDFISNDARDKYFAKPTFTGQAILKIVPTTKAATNKQISEASKQRDALAIVSALHGMLVENPHSLDQFKDRTIIVPVLSVKLNASGYLFCLYLHWNGADWNWRSGWGWIDDVWGVSVCVALLSQ